MRAGGDDNRTKLSKHWRPHVAARIGADSIG
jgi:hypothetical protein